MARKPAKVEDPADATESAAGVKSSELHKRAMARYKALSDHWAENRKRALEAIKFRAGDEWPEKIKKAREDKGRPVLTFRRGEQYIRQVVNDGRQNRPSPKYRPVDDKGDVKVANAYAGIVRSILAKSNADEAFDTALDHAAGGGFGYFRVLTEYVHDGGFEQDIVVRRIPNPLAVLLSPHQAADGSDTEDGFVVDEMSREAFKRAYPKAKLVDWKADADKYGDGWLTELNVRIAEYFYKEGTEDELLLLADGEAVLRADYDRLVAVDPSKVPEVVNTRTVRDVKVKWCRMSGAEVLEENEFPSRYIPIIPVYGTERNIDGKVVYEGMIATAKDALMLYDFERTAYCERVALTPKAPYIAAAGQLDDHPEWETANEDNHPYLTYNQVDVNGERAPPPRREQVADIPSHYAQSLQITEGDIQAGFGMYQASIGAPSNEKSGRAIMARQREGDTGTFHYHDNANRAVRLLGRILLDMIPRVIDTKRIVRMLGEDGEESMVMVNPELPSATGNLNGLEVFNLNAGRYDVDVSSGPSYTTKRQESADAQLEMARNNPEMWRTHGDLIVKSQDWPGADEFAKRSKALMPPEVKAAIAQAEQEGDDEGPSQEVRAIIEQAQQAVQQREEALQQAAAEIERLQKAEDDKAAELAIKEREVGVKEYEAETARMVATAPAMTPEQVQALVVQTLAQMTTPGDLGGGAVPAPMPIPPFPDEPMPDGFDLPPEVMPDMGEQPMPLN